ncbi:MAG: BamA/TamA family outer membrane protein [FCB group bacterium]|nr:BamA/TamA family outer membrane protein [FCB group bacterium]
MIPKNAAVPKKVFRFSFLFLFLSLVWSQSGPVVKRIEWIGNDITRDDIIRREIQHPVDMPLDSSMAQEDRDRLDNLGIFSEVRWQVVPTDNNQVILQFLVVESWRYLPGAIPVYEEETGWSLSGGLIINNYRGRNETLMIGGSFGGKNTFGINYSNPWISGDHISLDLEVGNNIYDHLFLPYKETTTYLGGKLGRYAGYTHKFKLSLEGYRSKFSSQELVDLNWTWIEITGQYFYDTRDIYIEPTKGILGSIGWSPRFFLDGHRNWSWNQSLSGYHTLITGKRPLVMAGNLSTAGLMGFREPVWLSYIGGGETVRGFPVPDQQIYENGEHPERFGYVQALGSIEFRQVIIPRHATKRRNEFGLTAALFLDAGTISETVADLPNQQPFWGFGWGLRVPMPILQIIRLDFGWGYHNQSWSGPGTYLRFGQKF